LIFLIFNVLSIFKFTSNILSVYNNFAGVQKNLSVIDKKHSFHFFYLYLPSAKMLWCLFINIMNDQMKKRLIIIAVICCCTAGIILATTAILKTTESQQETHKQSESMEQEIMLPQPSHKGEMSVEEALHTRRSIRTFSDKTLTQEQVSQLLWATYGVTMVSSSGREYKTAPSAGATYPLEIYLMAGNVDGIAPGLYKYNPGRNTLIQQQSGDLRKKTSDACLGQKMIAEAPVSIVFSAVYERTTARYGKRGEDRYVCMDLGHAAQNTYLQATAMGLGTCAVGAFEDDQLLKVLKLPDNEKVLYLMPVGYPK
jgi:SagB-type dehydrogenase family enzyme